MNNYEKKLLIQSLVNGSASITKSRLFLLLLGGNSGLKLALDLRCVDCSLLSCLLRVQLSLLGDRPRYVVLLALEELDDFCDALYSFRSESKGRLRRRVSPHRHETLCVGLV